MRKYISCRKRCIFLLIHIFGKTVKDGGGEPRRPENI